jgi:hypothetical protein
MLRAQAEDVKHAAAVLTRRDDDSDVDLIKRLLKAADQITKVQATLEKRLARARITR